MDLRISLCVCPTGSASLENPKYLGILWRDYPPFTAWGPSSHLALPTARGPNEARDHLSGLGILREVLQGWVEKQKWLELIHPSSRLPLTLLIHSHYLVLRYFPLPSKANSSTTASLWATVSVKLVPIAYNLTNMYDNIISNYWFPGKDQVNSKSMFHSSSKILWRWEISGFIPLCPNNYWRCLFCLWIWKMPLEVKMFREAGGRNAHPGIFGSSIQAGSGCASQV